MNEAPQTAPFSLNTAMFNPLVGNYRTSDGRWINLTMLQGFRYWADFCRHLERPDLIEDPRFESAEALFSPESTQAGHQVISEEIAKRPFSYWMEKFRTLDGQWAPVQDALEVGNDPQVRANGYVRTVIDEDGSQRELIANPVQFDNTPPNLRRAPQFAEHTDEILAELGHDQDRIIELKIAGAVT